VELYQVKYFLVLCETLSFVRAAEKCHVSQPSLTRAIQKLEGELGGLLIRRERRRTHLTELGKLVRPLLQEIQSRAEHIKSSAERHVSRERKVLRLGLLPSVGPIRLAPLFAELSAGNSGFELQLDEAPLPTLCDLLFRGELDAGLVAYVKRGDDRLRYQSLYKERLVCAMPRGHPLESCNAVRLLDLKGQDFLMRTNCDNRDLLVESCRREGFELHIVYRSAREDWIQAMIAAGCGITILPEFSRTFPDVVTRPVVEPALIRELSLVTVAGRPHCEAIAWVLRALRRRKLGPDDDSAHVVGPVQEWPDLAAVPQHPNDHTLRVSN
jgi:DNA-binding transcriptional LysR family regulator